MEHDMYFSELFKISARRSIEISFQMNNFGYFSYFDLLSVPLVEQQAKVIEMHTNLTVGHYVGEMGVDKWSNNKWYKEFDKNHVLVMTAQIFLDILRHGFLALSKVNLIGKLPF